MLIKNRIIQALSVSIVLLAAYSLWLEPLRGLKAANLKVIDAYFNLDSKISGLPEHGQDIVVVAIDDDSLRRIGIQWPWPRSLVAEIINKISAGRPRLISIDLVFAGRSIDPQEDEALINALKNAGNILAAAYFGGDGKYVMPDEPIASKLADFGFVNKPRDIDNTVRRMRPYFLSISNSIIDYSLSLKTASRILNVPETALAMSIPLSKDGTAYIKFYGNIGKLRTFPVWQIIDGSCDISGLNNKTVFLGVTSESFHDTYNTPLGIMPGLGIDMNETLTYIKSDFFRYAAKNTNLLIAFLFVLIAALASLRLPVFVGTFFSAALIAVSFFFGFGLFMLNIITDALGPIILIIISSVLLQGAKSLYLVLENIVLKKEAITDGLTGLYAYRYFELQLKREMNNATRSRLKLALVIYDIDHFKKINDTYGHEFGNVILKAIAKNLKNHSRKNNIIARYGGEEFCIIVPGMDRAHAIKYAERLRSLIGAQEFKTDKGETVRVTLSAGIAMVSDITSGDCSDFVKAADSALYRSKNTGRDRISVFDKTYIL